MSVGKHSHALRTSDIIRTALLKLVNLFKNKHIQQLIVDKSDGREDADRDGGCS